MACNGVASAVSIEETNGVCGMKEISIMADENINNENNRESDMK
jgi:hypothetical protein